MNAPLLDGSPFPSEFDVALDTTNIAEEAQRMVQALGGNAPHRTGAAAGEAPGTGVRAAAQRGACMHGQAPPLTQGCACTGGVGVAPSRLAPTPSPLAPRATAAQPASALRAAPSMASRGAAAPLSGFKGGAPGAALTLTPALGGAAGLAGASAASTPALVGGSKGVGGGSGVTSTFKMHTGAGACGQFSCPCPLSLRVPHSPVPKGGLGSTAGGSSGGGSAGMLSPAAVGLLEAQNGLLMERLLAAEQRATTAEQQAEQLKDQIQTMSFGDSLQVGAGVRRWGDRAPTRRAGGLNARVLARRAWPQASASEMEREARLCAEEQLQSANTQVLALQEAVSE